MCRKLFFLIVPFLVISFSSNAAKHMGNHATKGEAYTQAQVDFQNAMRKLWEDHIIWTRLYLVSAQANLPDKDLVLKRLLQNQKDIGDAVVPYYGAEAGKKLTDLLVDHIAIAGKIVTDLLTNEDPEADLNAWYVNSDDISTFLASANPQWNLAETKAMMREHLDTTKTEVIAHIQKNWAASIEAFDEVHLMILEMADHLSAGIFKQFPDRFLKK